MGKGISEKRLVDVLVCHFRETCVVAREVRHYEKRIDVAALASDPEEVWAIEAKTSDWSRALGQAIVNLAAADRSYIAIHSKNVRRVDFEVLDRYGVGLISVGTRWGDVRVIRSASTSLYLNRLANKRLRAHLSPKGVVK